VTDEIDDLSRSAVLHAACFPSEAAGKLAGHLYRFNRIPLTPRIRRRFPDALAVEDYLVGGASASSALRGWGRTPIMEGYECWMILRRGSRRGPGRGRSRGRASHKLYVAVDVDIVRDALHEAVQAAAAADVGTMKVGVTADALVRPDKLIIYATDREHLEAVAAELAPKLKGVPGHAVPFTSATASEGPLSWGMDPPESLREHGVSWRNLICRQLGVAIAAAHGTEEERSASALERLKEIGIDPATWTLRGTWDDVTPAVA